MIVNKMKEHIERAHAGLRLLQKFDRVPDYLIFLGIYNSDIPDTISDIKVIYTPNFIETPDLSCEMLYVPAYNKYYENYYYDIYTAGYEDYTEREEN